MGIYDVPIKLQCRNAENAAMDIYIYNMYLWLVVWNMNFIFHNIWEFHHPNSRSHIFQRSWNHQSGFAARLIAATPEPGRKRGEDRWVSPDPDPSFVANGTLRTSSTPSQILGISPVGQSQGLRTAGSEWHHVASSFALYCRELPITSYHQRSWWRSRCTSKFDGGHVS